MVEFAYTLVTGNIKPLLTKIRSVGVPQKITAQWLKTLGFTSSNDTGLIGVLRFVGLIDSSNIPTSLWTNFRGSNHKAVLGQAIQTGYAELFKLYPDAYQRSRTELDHFFSTNSGGGKQVISSTIATFKALADEAEFNVVEAANSDAELEPSTTPSAQTSKGQHPTATQSRLESSGPTLHVDIQIHISPEASSDQIDQIFASMAKHLYGRSAVK